MLKHCAFLLLLIAIVGIPQKNIILLKRMPLIRIGKNQKPQLQVDGKRNKKKEMRKSKIKRTAPCIASKVESCYRAVQENGTS